MLVHRERAFQFQPTRSGTHTQFHLTIRCSRCPTTRDFSSIRKLPDDFVHRKFSQWGWLMGKRRADDICPTCIGTKPAVQRLQMIPGNLEGKPTPAVADVVSLLDKRQDLLEAQGRARINQALDKLFDREGAAPSLSHAIDLETVLMPPDDADTDLGSGALIAKVDLLVRTMSDIHAALELQVEQNQRLFDQFVSMTNSITAIGGVVKNSQGQINESIAQAATALQELARKSAATAGIEPHETESKGTEEGSGGGVQRRRRQNLSSPPVRKRGVKGGAKSLISLAGESVAEDPR